MSKQMHGSRKKSVDTLNHEENLKFDMNIREPVAKKQCSAAPQARRRRRKQRKKRHSRSQKWTDQSNAIAWKKQKKDRQWDRCKEEHQKGSNSTLDFKQHAAVKMWQNRSKLAEYNKNLYSQSGQKFEEKQNQRRTLQGRTLCRPEQSQQPAGAPFQEW